MRATATNEAVSDAITLDVELTKRTGNETSSMKPHQHVQVHVKELGSRPEGLLDPPQITRCRGTWISWMKNVAEERAYSASPLRLRNSKARDGSRAVVPPPQQLQQSFTSTRLFFFGRAIVKVVPNTIERRNTELVVFHSDLRRRDSAWIFTSERFIVEVHGRV